MVTSGQHPINRFQQLWEVISKILYLTVEIQGVTAQREGRVIQITREDTGGGYGKKARCSQGACSQKILTHARCAVMSDSNAL
jgi:hypothetical protein